MTAAASEFYLRACPFTLSTFWGFQQRCGADVIDDGREAICTDGHRLTRAERALLRETK